MQRMTMTTVTAAMMALVMLATSGCVPAYLVQPSDVAHAEVPSVRERDGRPVTLQGGSFRVTKEPPLADGRVRVRGPGRHSAMWLAGLIITTVGVGLGVTAIGLAFKSATPNDSDGTNSNGSSAALMKSAIVLASFGTLGASILGPSIWIAGARQAPIELRY